MRQIVHKGKELVDYNPHLVLWPEAGLRGCANNVNKRILVCHQSHSPQDRVGYDSRKKNIK